MAAQKLLVHVFDGNPHHYIPMQSFFSQLEKSDLEQEFWVRNSQSEVQASYLNFEVTSYNTGDDLIGKLKQLPRDARVIFHGLFDINNIASKFIFTKMASRYSCVIWGAELYRHMNANRDIKQHLARFIHSLVLLRFNKVFALNVGDAELVKRILKKRNVQVLPYPLISDQFYFKSQVHLSEHSTLRILVGNSAAESNEHISALNSLAHLIEYNIEIHMPLNYGAEDNYVSKVVAHGKQIFGDKFIAITHMLDKDAYDKLLLDTDLVVLAHQRQQGLYVAYAMLQMGKPLFLRKNTSSFENLSTMGFSVNVTEELPQLSFENIKTLTATLNRKNSEIFEQTYTTKALSPKWREQLLSLFNN